MAVTYEVVLVGRSGREVRRPYTVDDPLRPGEVIVLDGRHWLIERVDPGDGAPGGRAQAKPARYRLRLRYPDGHEEAGAFRRYRPDAPRLGHAFSTLEDGALISWEVVEEQLVHDEAGEPHLDLVAARDWSEAGEVPDHELEHALARRGEDQLPEAAAATLARAERAGLAVELVALEAGEAPDWEEAERYIDALILEEIDDDLVEQCGVDPEADPRETWLGIIKERLLTDLQCLRADVEREHDQVEEWDLAGGRIFASVGSVDDESNPDSGHGWLCRLLDAGALGAAGFERVRKAQLDPELSP
jgi:hypothetical protein